MEDAKLEKVVPSDRNLNNEETESKFEKPKFSYVALINMALKTSPDGRMTVSEIYKYFEEAHPYFRTSDKKGWQNSVRHNLSLNDCFVKIPRDGVTSSMEKKGNYWALAAGYEDMFPDGNLKRRRRMKRPTKPYSEINPFELLQQQNYRENLVWNQHANDGYYMSTVVNQIPPPPYSLHSFSQPSFHQVSHGYTNVTNLHVGNFCFGGHFNQTETKATGGDSAYGSGSESDTLAGLF